MLTYLAVKNIAVIKQVSLEFSSGLNVITGETGAGKSVLVGALKYLTGDRQNKVTPRNADENFSAEGIFTDVSHLDEEYIDMYSIEEELILFRQTDTAGKNKAFANGRALPVNRLKDLSESLIDIHGQHENQFLFNASKHLSFIDFFIEDKLKDEYLSAYKEYRDKYLELENIKKSIDETNKLKDVYSFQFEEINSLNIDIEKDKDIEDKIKLLSSIEKVKEAVNICVDTLSDGEVSAIELIEKSIRSLSTISNVSEVVQKSEEHLTTALENINEGLEHIRSLVKDDDNFSTDDLNNLIDRKYKLIDLMKKYGGDLESVLLYRDKLSKDLENILSGEDISLKLQPEIEKLKKTAEEKAEILNNARYEQAKIISDKTENILKELELPSSKFEVKFTKLENLDSSAGLSAEFFISTNAGFAPASLASIASGGEISRVMLALKEVFADYDNIGTMLFDEIDTGISGKAAYSVAKKLKNLSRHKQIIVITHLPVVAAMGDNHFHISKQEKDGVSTTDIVKLESNAKINVIATMIAGEVTDASIAQAKDLIERN